MRCFLWSVIAGVYHGAAKPGSCVGKCGEWDADCWCNDACETHGNCCHDYEEQCGRKTCELCGKWTCDDWISWDPAKNSCESMLKDWGCTCKGCHCGHGTETSLVILSEEHYPEARCLDGTMAGYYVRKGISEQMLVFLEGGGWCYDQSCSPTDEGTLTDCQKRSYKNLGSSKSWEKILPERKLTGMLSADPKENPVFHNWTLVYVPYCDGTSFSGDAVVSFKGQDLHFKGRKILDAVFQSLRLDVTKQLVVSGGSAGALAVLLHIDSIAQDVTRSHGEIEVFGLADAGFFLDLPNMKGERCWPNQMRSIFNISNGYRSLSSACLKKNFWQPSDCIFPQYFGDLIKTRTFLAHSFYDDSEMYYTLGLDCWPGGGRGQRACNKKEMRAFDNLRLQHMSGWSRMLSNEARAHGVWAPACIAHTLTWGRWTDPLWQAALTDSKVERMRQTLEPMPRLCAKVVHGFGRGSKLLGFPTANMKIRWDVAESPEKLEPQEKDVLDFARSCEAGIYFGWAQVSNGSDRGIYKTAMSVGWNPTFPDVKAKTMEPWILHDYAEDFYDCELRLIICGFVRPEAKFADFKDLIVAIREDGEFCRETLDDEALAALAKDPFFIAKDAEVA